jgi:16S rRNA (guanine1207-N2)-methyltransferase
MNPALETLLLPISRGDLTISGPVLFLGAEPHPELRAWPDVTGWQAQRALATAWERSGFKRVDVPSGRFPLVLVLPGKSRDETLALFALAFDHLEDGGVMLAAMPNTAGAARFEKELASAAGEITSLQKHKCRAFYAVKSPAWNLPLIESWRQAGAVKPVEGTTCLAQAGIFSPQHIDPGSLLLTSHLPKSLHGAVADLGAGWGYLSLWAATHCPGIKRIDLYEADSRALALARENLAGVTENARFIWHDITTGLDEAYEHIIMNPPFHSGQTTNIALGASFIRAAAKSLRRGGHLYLVANQQLPYERELDAAGLVWRKAAETPVFKLLFATKRAVPPIR